MPSRGNVVKFLWVPAHISLPTSLCTWLCSVSVTVFVLFAFAFRWDSLAMYLCLALNWPSSCPTLSALRQQEHRGTPQLGKCRLNWSVPHPEWPRKHWVWWLTPVRSVAGVGLPWAAGSLNYVGSSRSAWTRMRPCINKTKTGSMSWLCG